MQTMAGDLGQGSRRVRPLHHPRRRISRARQSRICWLHFTGSS